MEEELYKLKPCPFCGGRAILEEYDHFCQVRCFSCGATIFTCFNYCNMKLDAVHKWNRRVEERR